MAYFRENDPEETRLQPPVRNSKEAQYDTQEYVESDYDDGFDDPEEPEDVPELTEEEKNAIRKKRFRVISGAGNLTAVITGSVVILILLALLRSMVSFVLNDADRNFTLFQMRF